MSRYRNRVLKATAAMWLLVLLADAGWVATSRATLTAVTLLSVCIVVSAVLFGRFVQSAKEPEPLSVRIRNDRGR